MKKETAFRSLVLFAFLSVFLAMSAQDKKESDVAEAQNRTVLENRIWNYDEVVYSTQGNISTSAEGYHFRGTRTIGEHEYSIFRDKDENEIALLREENRRVYLYCGEDDAEKGRFFHIIFPEDREDTSEALLYDFNLKEGDRFQCVGFDPLDATRGELLDAYITEVSEINVGGETFLCQQFRVDQPGFGEDKMYHYCAVEGVGNADGVLPFPQFGVYANHLSETYHFIRTLTDESGLVLFSRKDFPKDIAHYEPLPSSSKFNPEDTWEYRYAWWPKSEYGDESTTFYDVHKLEMKVVDEVSLDGKTYYRMSWNRKDTPEANDSHYFYLRVEDGAYYTYIPEEYCRGNNDVAPREYLLYDFNMEEGNEYEVPYMKVERYGSEGDMDIFYMPLETVRFHVSKNYTDEEGRRVLEMVCEGGGLFPYRMKVVEGIGPMVCGNIAMFFFSDRTGWEDWVPSIDFEALIDQEGDEIFISDQDRKVGFCKERDYTWVYAEFDKYGNVRYRKMGFNYLCNGSPSRPDVTIDYRRFGTLGVSNNPDGDWEKADFNRCYVREEDGKVWLYHTEGSLHVLYDVQAPRMESLIYDFGAADSEELTFYSPAGEKSAKIVTGLTEVGGEDKLSYTFEGSDGVKCVEGIGITKGGILPAVNTEFHRPASADDESFVGAVLVAVYDGEGNLIFRQDLPDAVEAISAPEGGFTAPEDRLYDLQGRELREPVPGQPYIKGGKVFVGTK